MRQNFLSNLSEKLGHYVLAPFAYLYNIIMLFYTSIKAFRIERRNSKQVPFKVILLQAYFTGIQALPIIIIAALVLGIVVVVELSAILPKFGAGSYVERLSIITIVRETAPIIVALIIIGRSGTAIATEIGNMKLNREVDVMDSLGINTDFYIVFPRIAGVTFAIFCLTIIFIATAVAGGFMVPKFLSILPKNALFSKFVSSIYLEDVIVLCLKAVFFGMAIALVSAYQGLSVKRSFTEVPKMATRGVVNSILMCFFLNVLISLYILPVSGL